MSETPNPSQPPSETPIGAPQGASGTPPETPGTPPPEPQSAGPVGSPPAPDMGEPMDVEKNRVFAMLSYIGILWLVPLLAAKDSPFARYHCNQGILFSIMAFGLFIVAMILWMVIIWIPILNLCGGCVLWLAVGGTVLTLMILGVVNALNGRMKPLPFFPVVTWVK